MIQVRNIANYRVGISSSYGGAQGRPLFFALSRNDVAYMTNEELKKWPTGAKADLAGYVQAGVLLVSDLTSVHTVNDTGNKPAPFSAMDLQSAIDTAEAFRVAYNQHLQSIAVHTAVDAANQELGVTPTNLATLTAFIVSLQGKFTAHAPAGVHPNADIVNAPVAATGTLAQDIAALQELYGVFAMHKKQSTAGVNMNPNTIITY